MNLLLSLKKKIANLFKPLSDEEYRRKRHNAGYCPKAIGGYNCKGSNNYKECE